MSEPEQRQQALREIAEIARRYALDPDDIQSYLNANAEPPSRRDNEILTRLFAYLGGLLVFTGLVIYSGMHWDAMSSIERIGITLGPGVIAYAVALACLSDPRYHRAITPLLLLAGLMLPGGLLVAIGEYAQGDDQRLALLLVLTAMIAVFGATFAAIRRSTALFLLLIYAASWFAVSFDLLELPANWSAIVVGGFLLAVTHGIARSRHVAISGVWYFAGSAILLIGAWDLLIPGRLDILYPGLAGLMLFVSLGERSRTMLLNSCFALTCFIGYYTIEYFENVGGWALLLITLGVLLLGMSKLALTLDRRYIRT